VEAEEECKDGDRQNAVTIVLAVSFAVCLISLIVVSYLACIWKKQRYVNS
jgi:hypothetical protein